MTTRRLLLHAGGSLASATAEIGEHLAGAQHAVFIPYAGRDHDDHAALTAQRLAELGVRLTGVQAWPDPAAAVAEADAIVVGGGNSFRLVRALHELRLIEPIRRRVAEGVPYAGWSAGANVACPTMRTTNDMPIVQPSTFDALGLVPFQINPHYIDDPLPEQRVGETRSQRIREFLDENDVLVLALRENSWLLVSDDTMTLRGTAGAVLLRRGDAARELKPGADISELLHASPRFDVALES
ncbi:MAG: dipeptidase PepE [Candidatus Dormibacteraeota bacterium]|nr:dipeptidase PepE [Candidatus Dormibacteraeota bacterium]